MKMDYSQNLYKLNNTFINELQERTLNSILDGLGSTGQEELHTIVNMCREIADKSGYSLYYSISGYDSRTKNINIGLLEIALKLFGLNVKMRQVVSPRTLNGEGLFEFIINWSGLL